MQRMRLGCLVLFCLLHMWTGSTNGCFVDDEGELKLQLDQKFITAAPGCAQIPCGYTGLPKTYGARKVWFKGSPEYPLSPAEVEEKKGLSRPLSIFTECSIILWDLIGQDRTEKYGLMLELRTNEKHIFPETVQVSFSAVKMIISQSAEVLVATKKTAITCTLSDLCLASDPKITWKGLRSKQYAPHRHRLKKGNVLKYYEQLYYTPVPEDHQAEITCEVTFGKNLTASATVALTVHSEPLILNSSACIQQQDLLTCMCVSQGVPLPDIHWLPLQEKNFTTVRASDGHMTVNSTFTITAEDFSKIGTVLCIGTNELGQANMTLPVIFEGNPDQANKLTVTSEGNPDQANKLTVIYEGNPDQANKLTVTSEGNPDQANKLTVIYEGNPDQTNKLTVTSEGNPDQTNKLTVTSEGNPDQANKLTVTSEGNPDQANKLTVTSEGNPDQANKPTVTSEGNPDQANKLTVTSEGNPDQANKPTVTSEGNPDSDTE